MKIFTPKTKIKLLATDNSAIKQVSFIQIQMILNVLGGQREKAESVVFYKFEPDNSKIIYCYGRSKNYLGGISWDPKKYKETDGLFISQ